MKNLTNGFNSSNRKLRFAIVTLALCVALTFTTMGTEAYASTGAAIGIEKAKAAALNDAELKASSVTFTKAKRDREDGRVVYDVEFYTKNYKYEYEISAKTGKVLEKEKEKRKVRNTANANSTSSTSNYIGLSTAKSIALKDAGLSSSSVRFTKAKRDREDGKVVYEIEFRSGSYEYEYEINAKTGKIIDKEIDREDDR